MNDDYMDVLKKYMKYYEETKLVAESNKGSTKNPDSLTRLTESLLSSTYLGDYDSIWETPTEYLLSPNPPKTELTKSRTTPTEPAEMKIEMNDERRDTLKKIMEWYWKDGNNRITKSDYEFVYDLWDHGLSFYGEEVQKRLNKIRTIYVDNKKQTGKNNK